jgi:hypothetical protein
LGHTVLGLFRRAIRTARFALKDDILAVRQSIPGFVSRVPVDLQIRQHIVHSVDLCLEFIDRQLKVFEVDFVLRLLLISVFRPKNGASINRIQS